MTDALIQKLNEVGIVRMVITPNLKLNPKEDFVEATQNIKAKNEIYQSFTIRAKSID